MMVGDDDLEAQGPPNPWNADGRRGRYRRYRFQGRTRWRLQRHRIKDWERQKINALAWRRTKRMLAYFLYRRGGDYRKLTDAHWDFLGEMYCPSEAVPAWHLQRRLKNPHFAMSVYEEIDRILEMKGVTSKTVVDMYSDLDEEARREVEDAAQRIRIRLSIQDRYAAMLGMTKGSTTKVKSVERQRIDADGRAGRIDRYLEASREQVIRRGTEMLSAAAERGLVDGDTRDYHALDRHDEGEMLEREALVALSRQEATVATKMIDDPDKFLDEVSPNPSLSDDTTESGS